MIGKHSQRSQEMQNEIINLPNNMEVRFFELKNYFVYNEYYHF